MSFFNKYFNEREIKSKHSYEIYDKLYARLEELSNIYDADVSDLVNVSIQHLIKTENVYQYKFNDTKEKRSIIYTKSSLKGLSELKEKHDMSIYKLINMAIKNALELEDA